MAQTAQNAEAWSTQQPNACLTSQAAGSPLEENSAFQGSHGQKRPRDASDEAEYGSYNQPTTHINPPSSGYYMNTLPYETQFMYMNAFGQPFSFPLSTIDPCQLFAGNVPQVSNNQFMFDSFQPATFPAYPAPTYTSQAPTPQPVAPGSSARLSWSPPVTPTPTSVMSDRRASYVLPPENMEACQTQMSDGSTSPAQTSPSDIATTQALPVQHIATQLVQGQTASAQSIPTPPYSAQTPSAHTTASGASPNMAPVAPMNPVSQPSTSPSLPAAQSPRARAKGTPTHSPVNQAAVASPTLPAQTPSSQPPTSQCSPKQRDEDGWVSTNPSPGVPREQARAKPKTQNRNRLPPSSHFSSFKAKPSPSRKRSFTTQPPRIQPKQDTPSRIQTGRPPAPRPTSQAQTQQPSQVHFPPLQPVQAQVQPSQVPSLRPQPARTASCSSIPVLFRQVPGLPTQANRSNETEAPEPPRPVRRQLGTDVFKMADFPFFYANNTNYFERPPLFHSFVKEPPNSSDPLGALSRDVTPWKFYIENWCPGRTLHRETNPWLQDFAKYEDATIKGALECISIICMSDYRECYIRQDNYVKRGQRLLTAAVDEMNDLNAKKDLTDAETERLISLLIIVSTIHAISLYRCNSGGYERIQHLPPSKFLWLPGLRRAEQMLIRSSRFRREFDHDPPLQLTPLQRSQVMLISQPLILSEMMSPICRKHLSGAGDIHESRSWLFHDGSASDIMADHGSCGLSRELLKIFHDITVLAARMAEEKSDDLMTGAYALRDRLRLFRLPDLAHTPTIETSITDTEEMKAKTKKAWVLTGLIYLYCRVWRLSRMHTIVQGLLQQLYDIIKVMPTHGDCYTIEAPFFPAFLLGVLSNVQVHQLQVERWLKGAWYLGVRGNALSYLFPFKKTLEWINDTNPPGAPNKLTRSVTQRCDWFEDFVVRLQENSGSFICYLTY